MFTAQQIDKFRQVHAEVTKRCHGNPQRAAEEDADAFDLILAEACRTNGVDPEDFEAWWAQPDAGTETLEAMGAFVNSDEPGTPHYPTPMFEEQELTINAIQAHTESIDSSLAESLGAQDEDKVKAVELCEEALTNHFRLTAWAIAQRFRLRLIETLYEVLPKKQPDANVHSAVFEELERIDFVNNENGPDSPVCASHDNCDANMPMNDAFADIMGHGMSVDEEGDCDMWNAAWRIAKEEGFGYGPAARHNKLFHGPAVITKEQLEVSEEG